MRVGTLVCSLAAAVVVLAACAPAAPTGDAAGPDGADTLTIATTSDVVNFNPLVGNSRTDYWVTNLMYPHLLSIAADGTKQAALATEWGYTGPTTGFYEIRDDMVWSDGTPLTASDVAFTLNAVKRDQPAGTLYGQMTNFVSAQAASDTRVELTLAQPDATVVPEIGFWGNVVPEHVFGPAGNVATFANDRDWVSAGPYQLTEVVRGQSYTLDRVAPYPLAPGGTPTLARVVYRVYADANTQILALRNGDVDLIANALPPAQVQNLRDTDGITVQEIPGLGYAHMTYNMAREPLGDLRVRRALAHAVDYEAIRTVVLQGQAISTGSSPITPVLTQFHDDSLQEYAFDPQLSRQFLTEAGYVADAAGNFGLSLRLIYSLQDPVTSQWAGLVRDSAALAGITIELQGLERNTYLAQTAAGDFDIYAGNFAIMDDPATNMTLTYLPGGAINYSYVDDPALSDLIRRAQATVDVDAQRDLVQQAAGLVHENVYDNVLYVQTQYVAHSDEWTGFVVKPSELLSVIDASSLAGVRRTG